MCLERRQSDEQVRPSLAGATWLHPATARSLAFSPPTLLHQRDDTACSLLSLMQHPKSSKLFGGDSSFATCSSRSFGSYHRQFLHRYFRLQ